MLKIIIYGGVICQLKFKKETQVLFPKIFNKFKKISWNMINFNFECHNVYHK